MGSLRFLGQAKVVGPGGDVLVSTGSKGGMAKVTIDTEAEIARARMVLNHLSERRIDVYDTRLGPTGLRPSAHPRN
jgi:hypothetical protein